MIESFIYKIWFSIEPIRTSNGTMEMRHGAEYEIEKLRSSNTGDQLYRIKGPFSGGDDWGRRDFIIVSERIYKLIETYMNEPEFIKIK
jgi:hypothetical protein